MNPSATVRADFDELHTFSEKLRTLSLDVLEARHYCSVRLDVGGVGAWQFIGKVGGMSESTNDTLRTRHAKLNELLSDAGKEVGECNRAYRTAQEDAITSIQEIEDEYGLRYGETPCLPSAHSTSTMDYPLREELKWCTWESNIPDLFYQVLGWLGVGNRSGAAYNVAVTVVPGLCDFITELEKFFAGDWNEVVYAAERLHHTADFHEKLADVLNSRCVAIMDTWKGNAAESANNWFSRLVAAIDELTQALRSTSDSYMKIATGVQATAAAIGMGIGFLAAAIISIVAELAAGAFTAGISTAGLPASIATAVASILQITTAIAVGITAGELLITGIYVMWGASSMDGIVSGTNRLANFEEFDGPKEYDPQPERRRRRRS